MTGQELDLGGGHSLTFTAWKPDRKLNPHYSNLPDVEKWGAIISHPHNATGLPCSGHITFDGPVQRQLSPDRPKWTVEAFDPLTISPSVLCDCGAHGWIRGGRWIDA